MKSGGNLRFSSSRARERTGFPLRQTNHDGWKIGFTITDMFVDKSVQPLLIAAFLMTLSVPSGLGCGHSCWISCIGPLIAGALIVALGGYGPAATLVGLVFHPRAVLPETRGKPLPHYV
jgi:hypothetical protein